MVLLADHEFDNLPLSPKGAEQELKLPQQQQGPRISTLPVDPEAMARFSAIIHAQIEKGMNICD